ncbi:hypothetical protein DGMP_18240 [Desulfomarina profundi]|uniref:Uncharacterized protein n=1 Tax=Desulfomarina profundi TaxID=2772557 RepID=A0A8D5JRK0_9BACT|nr:hypothetical protein [Desulfomarina profundi]BCL61131.1 hypothetical protein DGMP_18240 [Desulfomarina profundi]
MNSLHSLYFPETTIYTTRQYPLFLLFAPLHLLRIAENTLNIHADGNQATDTFLQAELCHEHIPAPLGGDLDRFIRLLQDIKNRKDNYASQLSGLTLAAMSGTDSLSEDSEQQILSSILGQGQPVVKKKIGNNKQELLWQARLVLALGELLDREEEEIALQLASLQAEETELFQELAGDEDSPLGDSPAQELSLIRQNMNPPHAGNMDKRLRSWKRLYREGNVPSCDLLVTTEKDAGELLFESYEKQHQATALHLGQVTLPALVHTDSHEAVEAIRDFREFARKPLADFSRLISRLQESERLEKTIDFNSVFSEFIPGWETALENRFPAEEFGRIPAGFYSLADTSIPQLLGAENSGHSSKNVILALVDINSRYRG